MPTQNAETVTQYLKKAQQLYNKAESDLPEGGILSHMYVVHWTYARLKAGDLRSSTWRLYKAALNCHLLSLTDDHEATEASVELLTLGNDGTRKKYPPRGSSKKMKHITPSQEYDFVDDHLVRRASSVNIALREWLIATLNTGARPCEWEHAALVEDGAFVRFMNAKATNGRGNGKYRNVPISHLDYDVQTAIRSHLDRVRQYVIENGAFQPFKKAMENAVYYESRLHFGKKKVYHVTLYTMRHQFAANAKASGLTKEEVAALMGHAVNDTADLHYARKNVGIPIPGLKGVPEEAATVRAGKPNPYHRSPERQEAE